MDYFELLKGSGGKKEQDGWFSDLLTECRDFAKEKIDEKDIQSYQYEIDAVSDEMKELKPEDFESKKEYDEAVDELETQLQNLEDDLEDLKLATRETDESKVNEQGGPKVGPIEVPPEQFDIIADTLQHFSYVSEELGHLEGKANVTIVFTDGERFIGVDPQGSEYPRYKTSVEYSLSDVIFAAANKDWFRKYDRGEEETWESKKVTESEVANLRDETPPPVDTHGQKLKKGDEVKVVGAAPEAEKGGVWVVDDLEEVATDKWNVWVHKKDDAEATDDFWAHKLELAESKVNELDEPDLERPEKARKGRRPLRPAPKRKRPRRPEPDVDREPKEEPRPEPKEEPRQEEEPREKPKMKPAPEEVPEIGVDPDRDDVPPPPEEIKPPEQPIEMRKEYLGRSEDIHYYFVTLEGEGGAIEDLVIADQEGVKKYSAKEKDIEVAEENIADFIIQAIRDIQIAQIERSIFMKYVYPQLEKMGPKEDMLEEPEEDEFGREKKPLGQEEEEERPRRRIAASKINNSGKFVTLQEFEEFMGKCVEQGGEGEFEVLWRTIQDHVGTQTFTTEDAAHEFATDLASDREYEGEQLKGVFVNSSKGSTPNFLESKNLIETQVIDGIGNEFAVSRGSNGTISINGKEIRFSPEFVAMWTEEDGEISNEGLEELALDALAMMEEDEYQELLAKNAEDKVTDLPIGAEPERAPEKELDISHGDDGKFYVTKGDKEVAGPYDTEDEAYSKIADLEQGGDDVSVPDDKGEDLSAPPIASATDDVDLSKAYVVREPEGGVKKSRPTDKYSEEEQEVRREEDHAAITGQPKYRPKKPIPDQPEGGLANKENETVKGDEMLNDLLEGDALAKLLNDAEAAEHKAAKLRRQMANQHKPGRKPCGEEKWNQWLADAKKQEVLAKNLRAKLHAAIKNPPKADEDIENKENENVKGENEMNKTAKDLLQEAEGLEAQAAELRKEADVLAEKDSTDEGIAPDPKASQEEIIKKLLEAGITETDVAKGTKALVLLAKEALKAGDYAKLGEFATKLAEIEAMIPAEAEAEVKDEGPAKDDKAPEKKDGPKKDEPKKDEPKKDELPKDDGPPEIGDEEKEKGPDEKKSPPHCDKCDKAHWPFDKCSESEEVVDEAKKDAEAKAKKEKEDKEAKAKKEKEDKEAKAEKAKKEKAAKAKKAKAKESKIPVEEPDEDLSESKSLASLKNLLDMRG